MSTNFWSCECVGPQGDAKQCPCALQTEKKLSDKYDYKQIKYIEDMMDDIIGIVKKARQ